MFLQVLDDDLDSLAAVSVYQESDNNNESLWCQYNSNDQAIATVPFSARITLEINISINIMLKVKTSFKLWRPISKEKRQGAQIS